MRASVSNLMASAELAGASLGYLLDPSILAWLDEQARSSTLAVTLGLWTLDHLRIGANPVGSGVKSTRFGLGNLRALVYLFDPLIAWLGKKTWLSTPGVTVGLNLWKGRANSAVKRRCQIITLCCAGEVSELVTIKALVYGLCFKRSTRL